MEAPGIPEDESWRLAELNRLALLDTVSEESYDRVVRLAKRLFGTPISLITLVDSDRQWFKANIGLEATETGRSESFCGHAILGSETMVIPDAQLDPRFVDNPLVVGDPSIRFYAGAPIVSPGGARIGTVCVIGREPRELSEAEILDLEDLASIVNAELASRSQAMVDELTQINNRRGFGLRAEALLSICARRNLPASLLYMDLNSFKLTNDKYGHDFGDARLVDFARLLGQAFRDSDVVGRQGGEWLPANWSNDPSARTGGY